ncbi:MAG: response regulator [Nitrospirae bacterium]|nr:response regulator [Nitrospirota bacterium]
MTNRTRSREAEILRAKQLTCDIMTSIPFALVVLDADLRVVSTSSSFRELFGHAKDFLFGKNIREVFPGAEGASVVGFITDAARSRETVKYQLCKYRGYPMEVCAVAVSSAEEERLLLLVIDVTRRKEVEEQLRQAEKLSAVGELMSGTAHELNNPLTVILGNAELLMKTDSIEDAHDMLDSILQAAHRCRRIVQNLLRFVRNEPPRKTPVDMNQLLDQTLTLRQYEFAVHDVKLLPEYDASLPTTAGDPCQISQVFLNLIGNAYDAMREKNKGGTLAIRTKAEDGRIRIDFEDDGPGFKDLSRAFEPFYTTKPVGSGTGLGLSVSYGIIKEHEGTMIAANRAEGGARISIWLPSVESITMTQAKPKQPKPAKVTRRGHILVVDNETMILQITKRILKDQHEVVTASDGQAALVALDSKDFDAVITDLTMPGSVGGVEIYAWIATHRPKLRDRVIFSTGDIVSDETRGFLSSLTNMILAKPFSPIDLTETLSQVLGSQTPPEQTALASMGRTP